MSEDNPGSVTHWIGDLKAGDPRAFELVWGRYFERLVMLARKKLRANAGRPSTGDEEDAALSAMNSLWELAANGRLAELEKRDELWRLMVVITARKSQRQVAYDQREKRGGGNVVMASALAGTGGDGEASVVDVLTGIVDSEPTPEFAAMVAEESKRRLDELPDPLLRQVALLRLEGYTNEEIAARLNCVVRTVERKLDLIRKLWQRVDPS